MKKIVCLAMLLLLVGCATQQAIQADSHNYKAIAIASCQDLTDLTNVAIVAATAIKIETKYQAAFAATVDPIIADVSAGVKVYCDAAQLVQDVNDWNSLLVKQDDIRKLVNDINTMVNAVKTQNQPAGAKTS
ncbi:MAG: hypothetical protein HQK60_18960 [Deltaproteobacteria bacterium]|nr:hypothetical protein [Deltaproteobacteria bacterium]